MQAAFDSFDDSAHPLHSLKHPSRTLQKDHRQTLVREVLELEAYAVKVVSRINSICKKNRYMARAGTIAIGKVRRNAEGTIESLEKTFRYISTIVRNDVRPSNAQYQRWSNRLRQHHVELKKIEASALEIPVQPHMIRFDVPATLKTIKRNHSALVDFTDGLGNHYSPAHANRFKVSDLLSPTRLF